MRFERFTDELRLETLHPFRQALRAGGNRGCVGHWRIQHAKDYPFGEMREFAYVARPIVRHYILLDGGRHFGNVALKTS
ncbi:hypothetical protein FQZ97_783660 [compost metagenome]